VLEFALSVLAVVRVFFGNIGTATVWLDDVSVEESDPGR